MRNTDAMCVIDTITFRPMIISIMERNARLTVEDLVVQKEDDAIYDTLRSPKLERSCCLLKQNSKAVPNMNL